MDCSTQSVKRQNGGQILLETIVCLMMFLGCVFFAIKYMAQTKSNLVKYDKIEKWRTYERR